MSETRGTLDVALTALRAHVDECMEFAREQERVTFVNLLQRDADMFSQCHHTAEDCPYCYWAKLYIENFLSKNPELLEAKNDIYE